MKLYNTLSKLKEDFTPLEEGKVRLYVCGPTVYDDAHLGHARSAVAFDLLRRWLMVKGYAVTFARNVTDIDDKIIAKAAKTGQNIEEISHFYAMRYRHDMEMLHILPPDIEPLATQNLAQMETMIHTLLKSDTAYQLPDGDIYFDVSKDIGYGRFKKQSEEELQSRVEYEGEKRNIRDFALWKAVNEEDVGFTTSLGRGRPGWHLECSAMIDAHLALKNGPYQIDIHGGGSDLSFPHHENECAQSACATGQQLAKYWVHNGFVTINGEKMSKSLGNSFFLNDALRIYDGEILRFYLLATHYRANFNFSEEDLLVAKKRLDKIYRLKKRAEGIDPSTTDSTFLSAFSEALDDDLNISLALAAIDAFIASANDKLDTTPKDKTLKSTILATLIFLGEVLGIGTKTAQEYFQLGVSIEELENISALIEKRTEAKKNKNFAEADALRDELLAKGITIMDTPNGTQWEKS